MCDIGVWLDKEDNTLLYWRGGGEGHSGWCSTLFEALYDPKAWSFEPRARPKTHLVVPVEML